jgi:hypothetical protein
MSTFVWPLLIYWLVVFVSSYVVVEIGQDQLYDEVTPRAGLKIAAGSLLIAAVLTWLRYRGDAVSYESMFTSNFMWTALQGIIWFGVFTLIYQFHPWHALGLGLATMVLVSGLATMGVESLLSKDAAAAVTRAAAVPTRPVRQSLSPGGLAPAAATPPAAEKAK